jgi:transcriptional regulator with XRE-family HTH domain
LLYVKKRKKAEAPGNGAPEARFGKRLAEIRRARGFSQYDLARELGISQRMVAYYEIQTERPPAHLLPRLAEILGVTSDQLLGIERLKENEAVRHLRLWRKLRQVEKLRPNDRRALLKMLDALLAQQAKK